MAKPQRRNPRPASPLVKAPVLIGNLDAVAVVGRLRQLHEDAEDPNVERMPADNEIYAALLYAERHASALRRIAVESQKQAALHRVELWEYLRERAEIHQAQAVVDARAAGVEWSQLAPALAVSAPSAAYNKAKRLRAASLSDARPQQVRLRRTPEAVAAAESRLAKEMAVEQRAQSAAQQRHRLVFPAAQSLVSQRDGLLLDEDAEYWLDEVEAVLPSCDTPTQMISLGRYLGAAVRALRKLEQHTAEPVAMTEEARAALAAAASVIPLEG
ncbi:hypothetical protein MBT84_47220 [Streptomyces sp. MBT84]|uniref:Uncharacterized protein n=2 Tax=Streptomyces TaxID=1883 RepID=A0ABP7LU33_9ACTN|nr:hypothetical protein [Streptomyces sp. MBT84]